MSYKALVPSGKKLVSHSASTSSGSPLARRKTDVIHIPASKSADPFHSPDTEISHETHETVASSYTIKTRIAFIVGTMATILVAASMFAVWTLWRVNADYSSMVEIRTEMLNEMQLVTRESGFIQKNILSSLLTDNKTTLNTLKEEIKNARGTIDTTVQKLGKELVTSGGAKLVDDVVASAKLYYAEVDAVMNFCMEGDSAIAYSRTKAKLQPSFQTYQKNLDALTAYVREATHTEVNAISQASSWDAKLALGITILALILGSLLAMRQIHSMTKVLSSIAENLSSISSATVSESASLAQSMIEMADNASVQAASLEETSASLEQMTGMTKSNSDNAQKAKDLSNEAKSAADKGAIEMKEMSEAMSEIQVASGEIAKIIKAIDEIAFQTNILALNAAVEAARAGEAGAGFAVVADEVRNLAQRSAVASKETAEKIDASLQKSVRGAEINARVAESLNLIQNRTQEVDSLVAEIARSSEDQRQGIEQINTSVGEIDKITQSNAESSQKNTFVTERLNTHAVSLDDSVHSLLSLLGSKR